MTTDEIVEQLWGDMSSCFVGPMPPQTFLDTFLCLPEDVMKGLPSFKMNLFSSVSTSSRKDEMYVKFVRFRSHFKFPFLILI